MTSYRTTNDLICAKNARWFRSTYIARKQFIFSTLSLKLQWHTRIYGETFHVTVAQTTQNIWKFMVGKSSLQEIATLAIIREISDSNLETGRYSPKSGVSRIIRESWHQNAADKSIIARNRTLTGNDSWNKNGSKSTSLKLQTMTFWTLWNEHLLPKRSAKMIDRTEKPKIPSKFAKRDTNNLPVILYETMS